MFWLHFVGRQYYSQKKFISEARKYGVTRRISLQNLKKMHWLDEVLLAIQPRKGESPVIFGTFQVEKLSGLSQQAVSHLTAEFDIEPIENEDLGTVVKRGCGQYVIGAAYVVRTPLSKIAEALESLQKKKIDIGKPMIGGAFKEHRLIRIPDIPFRMGFRAFNYEKFLDSIEERPGKLPVAKGQFYADCSGTGASEGTLETVKNYEKKVV